MRKILLTVLLIPSIVFAQVQGEPIGAGSNLQGLACRVNESQTNLADTEADANFCAADKKGNQFVRNVDASGNAEAIVPVSNSAGLNGGLRSINGYFVVGTDTIEAASTTTVLNLTAHAARVGDLIYPTGGTAGNIGVQIPICSVATNSVTLCYPLPATPSTDAITIRRPAPVLSGVTGNLFSTLVYDSVISGTSNSPISREDLPIVADNGLVVVGGQALSAIAQSVGTSGDAAPPSMDLGNRLVTTAAPPGEMFSNCSGTVTDTTSTAIKTAYASGRIYVTAIGCSNTSAVQSRIIFRDGATAVHVGAIPAAAGGGNYSMTFPLVPIRGSAATAFNMEMATTATSTQCCIQGYISTI